VSYILDIIDALLCDLLGRAPDAVVESQLAQLSDADWSHLFKTSHFHSVTTQIYLRLKGLKVISSEHLEPFKREYFLNARNNTLYFHEFNRLFNSLHEAEIPVIVVKGAFLAEHVYRNIAARIIGDVDLIFKIKDIERSLELVKELGYANRLLPLDSEQELSHEYGSPPSRPNSADLDIHWGLEATTSGFDIDTEGFWERSIPVLLADAPVRTLCPVDLLLHLCLHTSYHHHFQGGLRGLVDIREVIMHPPQPIDWDVFTRRSQEWRITRPVYFALRLTHELIGLPLPDGLLKNLFNGELPDSLYDAAMRNLFDSIESGATMTSDMARMLSSKTLSARIRLLLQAAFPSRGLLGRRYPVHAHSPFIWLFYPVRIFDLLRLYGLSILRATAKRKKTIQAANWMQEQNILKDWMSGRLDNN
jgi:hypothetical protein